MADVDFGAINAAARPRLSSLLPGWLPGGKRNGHEWVARNPTRNDRTPGSFSVNMKTGEWGDFSTGEKGGDPISLHAYLTGKSQVEAARSLADEVGTNGAVPIREASAAEPSWTPIMPVPADAPPMTSTFAARFAPAGYSVVKGYRYEDAECRLLGHVARYERPANGQPADKQFRPLVFAQDERGRREWRSIGFPTPRPLYGLPSLASNPTAPIIVTEGEKTADAAGKLFPGHVVVTSPNGSKSAGKADWSPLAGRDVVIWPDVDAPGAAYAADVVDMVTKAGAKSVAVVRLPAGLPEGWDLAEPIPDGMVLDLLRMVKDAGATTQLGNGVDDGADVWRSPDLTCLGTGRRPAPEFPTDMLGPFWGNWTIERAANASAPIDYVAVSLLAVASALLANVRWPLAG